MGNTNKDWELYFHILEDAYRSRFNAIFPLLTDGQVEEYNKAFEKLRKDAAGYLKIEKGGKTKRLFELLYSDENGTQPCFTGWLPPFQSET